LSMLFFTVGLYYFSNYYFWGNVETISGKILNGFPAIYIKNNLNSLITDPDKLYNQFMRIIIVFSSFVVFGIYYYFLIIRKNEYSKFCFFIFCIGCGSVSYMIMHLMYNTCNIREWYMTLPVFISIIMSVIILRKKKILQNVFLILSFVPLIYVLYVARIMNHKFESCYEYAKTLNSIVGEKERIYQVDFSGLVAFFSDRNMIDGDGLVNSFDYYDYMKEGRIDDYLKKYNVDYYSTYSVKDLLHDSIYIDDNFLDKTNGKTFIFDKSSLVIEKEFRWIHIAYKYIAKWYLFKFK